MVFSYPSAVSPAATVGIFGRYYDCDNDTDWLYDAAFRDQMNLDMRAEPQAIAACELHLVIARWHLYE
jgi:hypothetical protein